MYLHVVALEFLDFHDGEFTQGSVVDHGVQLSSQHSITENKKMICKASGLRNN